MNTLDTTFDRLRREGKTGLIAYLTAGFPDPETGARNMEIVARSGVDILEVGIPFSDPVADGPVLQKASQHALQQGMTVHRVFELCDRLGKKTRIPLVLMTYYNPVYRHGLSSFAKDCSRTGVAGVIVADLTFEESDPLASALARHDIPLIRFVTPFTSDDRMRKIAENAAGFLYFISSAGVTGSRSRLDPALPAVVSRLRKITALPVAVGFGISRPAQVRALAGTADAVIIGSYFVDRIASAGIRAVEKDVKKFNNILYTSSSSPKRKR